jgi:hypothetical protein
MIGSDRVLSCPLAARNGMIPHKLRCRMHRAAVAALLTLAIEIS